VINGLVCDLIRFVLSAVPLLLLDVRLEAVLLLSVCLCSVFCGRVRLARVKAPTPSFGVVLSFLTDESPPTHLVCIADAAAHNTGMVCDSCGFTFLSGLFFAHDGKTRFLFYLFLFHFFF
jgi:hypothetical protein